MTTPEKLAFKLYEEQEAAIKIIEAFLEAPTGEGDDAFFLLEGGAGTGKTFSIQALTTRVRGRFIFTAPTNKATKVLRETLTKPDYTPECRTIYSLLGLRLEANGEVKELKAPDETVDLSAYKAVIVDEGSMVPKLLLDHIRTTSALYKLKFIFMQDEAQINPVGEDKSEVGTIKNKVALQTVRRHDNQILELVTRIRKQVYAFSPSIKLASNNDGVEGVWKLPQTDFVACVTDHAIAGNFSIPNHSKLIAWRNVEVDKYNAYIRGKIFPGVTSPWVVGDRVIFTSPAWDLDDDPMASTDDEGEITRVEVEYHALHGDIKIWRLSITLDDNRTVTARVLHHEGQAAYTRQLDTLSVIARSNSRKWAEFWEFKEAFHSLRHAYAITAHRSQGSTYDTTFVIWQDILLNRNRTEAYRCLYVGCSRASKRLILS